MSMWSFFLFGRNMNIESQISVLKIVQNVKKMAYQFWKELQTNVDFEFDADSF